MSLVIPHENLLRLLEQARQGDMGARSQIVEANLGLVHAVVGRFSGVDREELFQVGCLGLLKAIDRFDPHLGTRFSTYAFHMIMGEIRRYLRDNWQLTVPRRMKEVARKAKEVSEELSKRLGRCPKVNEIAAEMGIQVEDIMEAMEACTPIQSLQAPLNPGQSDDASLENVVGTEESALDLIALKQCLAQMEPRKRRVIMLRYFAGKTQAEVADAMGISQAQVSRLESAAIHQMRQSLSG
ncbi:MAG TPA: SigB/SigF/SigG family RNA polymerase sigma factor [Firmicutes bacterium]|nr:SigB/SigF/SigG family RNA polymerase sigma factor [Bacillota bacterium]